MSDDHDSLPEPPGAQRWGALATMCLAVTVIVMDGSIVNVALPTLSERLPDVSASRLQWIVDAYLLAFASLLLVAGAAADRFGRRRMLLVGLTLFAATSTGAALAPSAASLIAWRAMMGVGAAMIFPSTLAIIADAFKAPGERRFAISAWAGVSGLGVAIGPVAGGWLLEHYSWGSIFLVNIPLIVAAMMGALTTTRESRDPEGGSLDPVGNVVAALGILMLVGALIEAPELGWVSAPIVASFATAATLLGGFIAWERRARRPMLDPAWFENPSFAAGCLALASAFFCLFGFVFMVTQYFQFVRGYDAFEAGLRTMPFAAFILMGAMLASRLGGERSRRWLVGGGLLLMAIGFAWSTRDQQATSYGLLVAQMGTVGVGLGLVNAAGTEAIMGSLPRSRAGAGSSVNDTVREVGGAFGVALMGSLFNSVYRESLGGALAAAPLPPDAKAMMLKSAGAAGMVIGRIESIGGAAAASRAREAVVNAFLEGFHAASWGACLVALIGGAMAWWRFSARPAKISDEACGDA